MYVDTHIHLTHHSFDGEFPCICECDGETEIRHLDRKGLIEQFKNSSIAFVVEPGISLESNKGILSLAGEYPGYVLPVTGIHPTRTPHTKWKERKSLESISQDPRVVAIGELGLDYHYDRKDQHRLKQKLWFIWQLKLADKRKLPLVLHIRLAHGDALKILRHYKRGIHGGICHCFNEGPELAKIYTEEFGFMLGIGGSLLQEGAENLRQAVIETPLENIVLETDGPFVKAEKPAGISGKQWKKARNTSLIIPSIAGKIAELKNIDTTEVERITTENAMRFFGIDKLML